MSTTDQAFKQQKTGSFTFYYFTRLRPNVLFVGNMMVVVMVVLTCLLTKDGIGDGNILMLLLTKDGIWDGSQRGPSFTNERDDDNDDASTVHH